MLHATYSIPLAGTKRQSTRRADREVTAWSNVLANLADTGDANITGGSGDVVKDIGVRFARLGVPLPRAALWARALNGELLGLTDWNPPTGITLSDYQVNSLERMSCAGHILALDTGLGKTLTTVTAAIKLSELYPARCFICCPVNAVGAWSEYVTLLEEHFNEVAIVSIDSLHKLKGLDASLGGVVVFDEAHLLGSSSTKRTKEAHSVRSKFDYGLCLTGTLLHAGLEKALNVLDLAVPGASRFSSTWTAGDYFDCIVRKEVPGRGIVSALEKPSKTNFEAFMHFLQPFTIIIKKHSELASEAGIPPQQKEIVKLGTPWLPLREYIVGWAQAYIEEHGEMPHAQQAAAALRREGLDSKLEWVRLFTQTHDEPIVLFAWSKASLATTEQFLTEQNLNYVYVDGGVTGKSRIEAVRQFQEGEVSIYLGQIDASCVAANLFKSRISIALETTNRSANYDQSLGRTCRRGQTRECLHYDLVTNPLQNNIVKTVRSGMDFDASAAEWMEINNVLKAEGYKT